MSGPNSIESELLAKCGELLRFAAENKTGLSGDVVTDIENAWEAQAQSTWTPQIAAKFWAAYDKLCSHLQPVTLDTLRAAQPVDTWLSLARLTGKSSLSSRWAGRFQVLLFAVFIVSMVLSYIATTGEILLKDTNEFLKHGNEDIEAIRNVLAERPSAIAGDTDFDAAALEPANRTWVSKLRKQLIDLWTTADRLYDDTNALVASRFLGLGQYRLCTENEYPSADHVCYLRGTIRDPATMREVSEQISDFYHFFETQRVVRARTDQVSVRLAAIKAYFLPAFLGMLGACTYVVRTISDQIKDFTFSSASPLRHALRVVLGPVVGVAVVTLYGVSSDGGLTIDKLSAPAWAFVAGYAMEAVFAAFDAIAAKLKA